MTFQRIWPWLIVAAVLLGGAASARAQEDQQLTPGGLQPFGPVDLGGIADMQLFAPPETVSQSQDGFFHGNTGPFFEYERFYWSIRQPGESPVGIVGITNVDNQFIKPGFVWGNRFEFGYVNDDGYGWMTSIIKSNTQSQSLIADHPVDLGLVNVINTGAPADIVNPVVGTVSGIVPPTLTNLLFPELSPLPGSGVPNPLFGAVPQVFQELEFQPLTAQNVTRITGVELMKTYRYEPGHKGGIWQILFGARYFQLHDRFTVSGTTLPSGAVALISPSFVVPAPDPVTGLGGNFPGQSIDGAPFGGQNNTLPPPFNGPPFNKAAPNQNLFPPQQVTTSTPQGGTSILSSTTVVDERNFEVDFNVPSATDFWDTVVDNNLVGPQLGVHWEDTRGPWTFISEFRFTPAANFQNVHQDGAVGAGYTVSVTQTDKISTNRVTQITTTNTPPGTPSVINTSETTGPVTNTQTVVSNTVTPGQPLSSFNRNLNTVEFAPIGELRLDEVYQLTKSASLKFGYTATLISGIGRASEQVDYSLPTLGIIRGARNQHIFIDGINFGIEINR